MGNYDKAVKDFDEAIRIAPECAVAYGWRGWLLAMCPVERLRDSKQAIEVAIKACELSGWKSGWQLNTLAATYAEVGQFDEAERYQSKALDDPDYCGTAGDEFRKRLELYRQTKPLR
jgi:tetratricopeptide (TPR) repeat protein